LIPQKIIHLALGVIVGGVVLRKMVDDRKSISCEST